MASGPANLILRHVRGIQLAKAREQLSDRELLRQFTRGDESAFAALVRRHGAMVLGVGRRVLRQWADADDVFQATFLTLARRARSRRWHASVGNWLYLVAYRIALNARAASECRAHHEGQARTAAPADPLAAVSGRELCGILDEELARLPERLRAPLVSCCLEGQTRDEAAKALGWSLGTLKRRLEQGRVLLRSRLEKRGFTLPATLAGVLVAEGVAQAAIPAGLLRTAVAAATDGTAASARVLALANAFLPRALLSRFRAAAIVLLTASLVSAGLGGLSLAIGHPEPISENPQSAEPAQSKTDPAPQHVDAYGDPLPAEAVARLGTLRLYHGNEVRRVILSPDAKLVVSFSQRDGNRLWDAVTGRELPLKEGAKVAHVFTARAKLLAVGKRENDELVCSDLASGEVVRLPLDTPEAKRPQPVPIADQDILSPDGAIRAVTKEKGIHLYDARSGKELDPLADQEGRGAYSLAFSPDSKLLAGSYTSGVRLWDIATRKPIQHCRAKDYFVGHIVFSTDGKTLAGADGSSVTLWDVATGKWRHEFHHTYLVGALAFLPDGKTILSGSSYNDPSDFGIRSRAAKRASGAGIR
jgi:RNA polymerase sigma factor (sigma-70 family)